MIMPLYDCELFLHDLVIKHNGFCTSSMLFISMFFMVPTCIHPMVAMARCVVVSYPRLHGHLVMEDKILTFLYRSHFGLHDCKSDHVVLMMLDIGFQRSFDFHIYCKYGCEPFRLTVPS